MKVTPCAANLIRENCNCANGGKSPALIDHASNCAAVDRTIAVVEDRRLSFQDLIANACDQRRTIRILPGRSIKVVRSNGKIAVESFKFWALEAAYMLDEKTWLDAQRGYPGPPEEARARYLTESAAPHYPAETFLVELDRLIQTQVRAVRSLFPECKPRRVFERRGRYIGTIGRRAARCPDTNCSGWHFEVQAPHVRRKRLYCSTTLVVRPDGDLEVV